MASSLLLRSWLWSSAIFLWLPASASWLCSECRPQRAVFLPLLPGDHAYQSQAGCPEHQHLFWGHSWNWTTMASVMSILAWFFDIGSNSLGQEVRSWMEEGVSECFPPAWTNSHPHGSTGASEWSSFISKQRASPVSAANFEWPSASSSELPRGSGSKYSQGTQVHWSRCAIAIAPIPPGVAFSSPWC